MMKYPQFITMYGYSMGYSLYGYSRGIVLKWIIYHLCIIVFSIVDTMSL